MSLAEENSLRTCLKESERLLREAVARGKMLYAELEDCKLQSKLRELELAKTRKELETLQRANEDLSYTSMMSKKNESAMRTLLEESERTFAANQAEIATLRTEREASTRALRQAEDRSQVLQFKLEAVQRDYAELMMASERGGANRMPHSTACTCRTCTRRIKVSSFTSTTVRFPFDGVPPSSWGCRARRATGQRGTTMRRGGTRCAGGSRTGPGRLRLQMAAERRLNAALEERLEAERQRWSSSRSQAQRKAPASADRRPTARRRSSAEAAPKPARALPKEEGERSSSESPKAPAPARRAAPATPPARPTPGSRTGSRRNSASEPPPAPVLPPSAAAARAGGPGIVQTVLSSLGLRQRPGGGAGPGVGEAVLLHVPENRVSHNDRYNSHTPPKQVLEEPGDSSDEGYGSGGGAPCPLPPSEGPSSPLAANASMLLRCPPPLDEGPDDAVRSPGAAWVAAWADARVSGGSGSDVPGLGQTAADFAAWTRAQAGQAGSVELSKLTMMLEALTEQVLYLEKASARLKARSRECRVCSRGAQTHRGPERRPHPAPSCFPPAVSAADALATHRRLQAAPEPVKHSSPSPVGTRHFRTPSRDLRTVFEANSGMAETAPIA